jgi:hypothetical protein
MTNDARLLEPARARANLTLRELWLNYFSIGGNSDLLEIEAYLSGALMPTDIEYDYIAQALNDRFIELGMNHPVPYAQK